MTKFMQSEIILEIVLLCLRHKLDKTSEFTTNHSARLVYVKSNAHKLSIYFPMHFATVLLHPFESLPLSNEYATRFLRGACIRSNYCVGIRSNLMHWVEFNMHALGRIMVLALGRI